MRNRYELAKHGFQIVFHGGGGFDVEFLDEYVSTGSVTKDGSVGPRRMFLIPRCNSVSRIATAFCSYQLNTIDNGKLLTSVSKALANATAI